LETLVHNRTNILLIARTFQLHIKVRSLDNHEIADND